ncbi:MAG: hypothetical protein EOR84_29475 [Mesorhizobium sp.]|uniref:hypothetical protein n=1 Tax=Mesorhizobium sp. TaxID=1871066 RepID=UPI000FE88B04|nr:hypothetical protein [Mesorhizobium sp.]RWM87423.1 MAG: hypothetical protein EOR84_29475 [Mesorhizobium sp.]
MRKLLALALLIVLPPLAFYGWFEVSVRRIVTEQGLDGSYRNALKHASTSSYLYSGLRLLGLSEAIAEEMVVRCGMVNEFAELYVKRGKPDTTLEIMKDLQNNMVGIGVARWLENNSAETRVTLFVVLGQQGILALSQNTLGFSVSGESAADYPGAKNWFMTRREQIDRDVQSALDIVARRQGNLIGESRGER